MVACKHHEPHSDGTGYVSGTLLLHSSTSDHGKYHRKQAVEENNAQRIVISMASNLIEFHFRLSSLSSIELSSTQAILIIFSSELQRLSALF